MSKLLLEPSFFTDALGENVSAIAVKIEAAIVAGSPGRAVIPCGTLELEHFAQLQMCEIAPEPEPRPSLYRYWGGDDHDRLLTSYDQVVWQVQ